MWWGRKRKPTLSCVLTMDALGFSSKLRGVDENGLIALWEQIDRQFLKFQAKVPHKIVLTTPWGVLGSRDFETMRLNDMFVLYSRRPLKDAALRYLISASLLYQTMLLEGFIPRGGLGHGLIIRGNGLLVGPGFLDAYEYAEKRPAHLKDICAIQISELFWRNMAPSAHSGRLICFYNGAFFVHPFRLVDPDLCELSRDGVIDCLKRAGTANDKIAATTKFLDEMEDYEAAGQKNSKARKFVTSMMLAGRPPAYP